MGDTGWTRLLVATLAVAGLTVVGALALLGVTQSPAAAQSGSEIRAAHSDKCLGVEGASTVQEAYVVQQTCTGAAHQRWTVTDLGNGYNEIRVAHTGMCLNVQYGSVANLARLIQWPCTATAANDDFQLVPSDAGGYEIVARHSGSCLGVSGAEQADGAAVVQYTCYGYDHQRFLLNLGPGSGPDPATNGSWGPVQTLSMVPVAASALPDGRVLMWSSSQTYAIGGQNFTYSLIFDPATGNYTDRTVTATGHDMFCPGIAHLADGRILINGGTSSFETTIYDPASDSWIDAADMNVPRGYNGTTLLDDGRAFTVGGSWSGGQGNKVAEVWSEDGGWSRLTGIPAEPLSGDDPRGIFRADNHMWLFGWTNGRVFHAGPSRAMHWLDTKGSGSYSFAGNRGDDAYAMNGNAVMYAPGRILAVGGAPAYDGGVATARATVIDINGSAVTSRSVSPMAGARAFQSSVVLPNGEVLVTGGQKVALPFSDDGSALVAEVWDPATERFSSLAPMSVPRTYHSFSLLLPDGRVIVGGGGLCGNCTTNHPDVQVFSPPYLFNTDGSPASRPSVSGVPSKVDLGQKVTVSTDRTITEFALVRASSATHAVNNDQRRIPVSFSGDRSAYTLTMPTEGGVAIPGSYYLFAIDAQGVPSVATTVQITTDTAVTVPDTAAIGGSVTTATGAGVAGVKADLFSEGRSVFLASTTTDADGGYGFDVDAGCYVVTFVAPDGTSFDSGRYKNRSGCVDAGDTLTIDAALVGGGTNATAVTGRVLSGSGGGVSGVGVDLFTEGRANWVRSTVTDGSGNYRFDLSEGCWVLTFKAPTGTTFTNGSRWLNRSFCVSAGQTVSGIDATLSGGTTAGSGTLDGVVSTIAGSTVSGVDVELFTVAGDGGRGSFVTDTATDGSGRYRFTATAGCWYLTFIAPDGRVWDSTGSKWLNARACVDAGAVTVTSPRLR